MSRSIRESCLWVRDLDGLSYAEIERVALDAVKTAVLKKRNSVTETDFAAALGAIRRTSAQSGRRERMSTAAH
jgi:ATP-dependent 26S proteasome regulatory subunit